MPVLQPSFGPLVLLGSGETSPSGGRVFEAIARQLAAPVQIAIIETPAGFQPNSAQVAGKVVDFMQRRLGNYHPTISVIPARQRGTAFSPDDQAILAPLLEANFIFMGAGSPSYTAAQLRDSRTWQTIIARQRLGAALVLSSAATIAMSRYALPVYEIYKVGSELHWLPGLDVLGAYGLEVAILPHWNNTEGGAELDTSHSYMGAERFERLRALLPPTTTIVGIDEHSALTIDAAAGLCRVEGVGGVTVLRGATEQHWARGQQFALSELGEIQLPAPEAGIPAAIWAAAQTAHSAPAPETTAPATVLALAEQRQTAREQRDWAAADALRQQILAQGWNVLDTAEGPRLEAVEVAA
jgi:cyanophycinase-like exopeptidase